MMILSLYYVLILLSNTILNQEKGSEEISQSISNAIISSVNLSEVVAKLAEGGIAEKDIEQILVNLGLEVIPFNQEQALRAGILRPLTKSLGLSLGDRACLGLGISLNLPVLTTDQVWANLNLGVEVQLIR